LCITVSGGVVKVVISQALLVEMTRAFCLWKLGEPVAREGMDKWPAQG
jgi:hypothetical protein